MLINVSSTTKLHQSHDHVCLLQNLILCFQGADQLTEQRSFFVFVRRTFDVSLITPFFGSFNRKLFLASNISTARVMKSSPSWYFLSLSLSLFFLKGSANKMRTNYCCQIDIVKQFIISSMSSDDDDHKKKKLRDNNPNWCFNNNFLSFCMFFFLSFSSDQSRNL